VTNKPEWHPPRPIAQAPIKKGQYYGPCLLSPGINGEEWVVGECDGEGWFAVSGERVAPTHYLLLPPRSTLVC
jgi:hypothetical protein